MHFSFFNVISLALCLMKAVKYVFIPGDPGKCPQSINKVASSVSRTAVVDFSVGEMFQQFELPIGKHPYSVKKGALSCFFSVNIFG